MATFGTTAGRVAGTVPRVATELEVQLRGAPAELEARNVLAQMSELIRLLGQIEDVAIKADRRDGDRSSWGFTRLAVGSVDAALAPIEPRGGADWGVLDRAPLTLVDGFAHASQAEDIPAGWTEESSRTGAKIAKPLGLNADRAMVLRVLVDGNEVRKVEVTRRHHTNLVAAAKARRASVGSALGTLASVNTRRKLAGLWTDLDDRLVRVRLNPDLVANIGEHIGQRVQVAGELTRNSAGQLLSVKADRIEALGRPTLRLVDSFGLASDHLKGEHPVTYLDRVGGWA